jgi:hypothetical protein
MIVVYNAGVYIESFKIYMVIMLRVHCILRAVSVNGSIGSTTESACVVNTLRIRCLSICLKLVIYIGSFKKG